MLNSGGGADQSGTEAWLCQVTVLFADLSGYTSLTEKSDAEDVDRLRDQLLSTAKRLIRQHGGRVNQIYGDGLMAVFGLPTIHEEDPRRAIAAAIELHEAVRALPMEGKFPAGFQPRMHSGIESGVVLARQGDPLKGIYELTGNAVNTAARLCSLARADELLVGAETMRGLEPLFELEAIAPLTLRGLERPVPAYRVLRRSNVSTRFEARARRGLTPFVGRAAELERLRRAIGAALAGPSRLLAIVGAPGIGKSRLIEELMHGLAAGDTVVCRATCESFGNVAPLQPFIQALRQLFDIGPDLSPEDAVLSVERHLASLPELAPRLETLLQILSLRPWPQDATHSSDQAQETIVNALTELFEALVARRPLVMSIDDWQWADDASRHVLGSVVRALKPRRAAFLLASRALVPEDPLVTDAEIVALEPFTTEESSRAIELLLPNTLDLGVSAAIYRRSGGNPLFLEELCQTLPPQASTSGEGLAESNIPNTIHGLIQSRIERLPARQVDLLRVASVIGSEFPHWLLERVSGPGPDLDATLEVLAGGDLIHPAGTAGTYRFKHEITRDGVYRLIRRDERRQIHGKVARAIEERFAGAGLREHYEALAYHYTRCEDHARAVEFADLAGDKAAATSALDRARLQYRAALDELDTAAGSAAPQAAQLRRWLTIAMKWASTCVFSPALEQLGVLQRTAEYAQHLNDPDVIAHAEYWLGWIYYALGDQDLAIAHYRRALPFAEQAANRKLKAQLLSNLGQSHGASGDYDQALVLLEEGIGLKRAGAQRSAKRAVPIGFCYALCCEALIHGDRGDFAAADTCLREALESVRYSGHAVEGSLLGGRALIQMWQSCWSECIASAALTRTTAERVNGPYVFAMSEMVSGYARWVQERSPAAIQQLQRAADWIESRGMRLYLSCTYAQLAEALAGAGDGDRARLYAERAIARRSERDPIGEASAYRTLARLAHRTRGTRLADDDLEDTATYLLKAFASAERRGSARERAITRLLQGELALDSDPVSARAHLEAARAELERMRMPGYLADATRWLGLL